MIQTPSARFSLNLIGAITSQGEFRFMTFKGTMDPDLFTEFLKWNLDHKI